MNSRAAEPSTFTINCLNEASVLYIFVTLHIRGINDVRFVPKPVHVPSSELEGTDINTSFIKAVNRRILADLLGIREETVYPIYGV